jgi:hypothetical protein
LEEDNRHFPGGHRMKSLLLAIAASAAALPAWATDVGVSVSVNQPGLYGRVDIGNVPQPPALLYPQPVIIHQAPVAVHQSPIYLRVPPGHARNWGKHCGRYNACGQQVYFVREDWYQQHYLPAQGGQGHERAEGPGHGRSRGHGGGQGNKH